MIDKGKSDQPAGGRSANDEMTALFAQAVSLHQAGRLDEAKKLYEKLLAIDDKNSGALCNLGIIISQRGDHAEAIRLIQRSLEILPNQPVAANVLGMLFQNLNRLEEALASYDRALALRPDFFEAHYYRGNTLQYLNRFDEALASYDRALALRPDSGEPHNNRGNVLKNLGRTDEALASYERALALQPEYAEAHYNRGNALQLMKRFDEALASYEHALALKPDYPYLLGTWMHCKMQGCDWKDLEAAWDRVKHAIDLRQRVAAPFGILAMPSTPAQQQLCAQICIRDRFPRHPVPLWQGDRYAHDRIRLGYFSSDFGDHPVSHLIAQMIESHDRRRFEVIGYSFGPPTHDAWRERLEKAFDHVLDVGSRSDREIAAMAREREIDIAIDLNGFTNNARTGIFALRPAPVQVNYLGYPGTLGADYYDYMIADSTVIPPEHVAYYNEKIAYLPHTFQVNNTTREISDRSFSRAELGLPVDSFVFCCFNHNYKITPDLFDIWMRLLRGVSASVLWLSGGNAVAGRNLRREAEKRGISPVRVIFAPRVESLADHLARYRQADLFLDTFYYNAHTTASDALWAGLPVITCLGNTFASRVAASLLNAVGLPELITRSHADYESTALELANHPEHLAAIRRKLASNRTTHPLFSIADFTRHIQTAYMKMHERNQAGLAPDHIVIQA